tara:strand:- start:50760 stop:51197 length:438 start_codon:yes stop_codon:yes gene_type:complete
MQNKIDIVKLRENASIPVKQSELATGYDLCACLESPSILISDAPQLVPTGIAISIPAGLDVQIRPRSGLTLKGIMAGFGTIDADYRGEIFVTLYCLPSLGKYEIKQGERIAQLVVSKSEQFIWNEVLNLDATKRGQEGHGSTGKQ